MYRFLMTQLLKLSGHYQVFQQNVQAIFDTYESGHAYITEEGYVWIPTKAHLPYDELFEWLLEQFTRENELVSLWDVKSGLLLLYPADVASHTPYLKERLR